MQGLGPPGPARKARLVPPPPTGAKMPFREALSGRRFCRRDEALDGHERPQSAVAISVTGVSRRLWVPRPRTGWGEEKEHAWGYTGAVLGPYWGCTGAVLGLYWGCTGATLGLHWGCTGVALGLHWGCTGAALGLHLELQ